MHTRHARLMPMLLLLALSGVSFADAIPRGAAYMLTDHFGGTWSDAEKSPLITDDDNLCWAAAASNVLAWGGWGEAAGFSSSDGIFAYLQQHWTNEGGYIDAAWNWWVYGVNPYAGRVGTAQVDVPGGNFSPDADYSYEYKHYTITSMADIDKYLHLGRGVAVLISGNGPSGHAITCWGINIDVTDPAKYVGIWVSDSDDDKSNPDAPDRLRYYNVKYIGMQWYLEDFYGTFDTWAIQRVDSLAPIPEPATIATLAAGGFWLLRRRKAA